MKITELPDYTNHHPENKAIYFTEQPESIKWAVVNAGIVGSGCQDQCCSQSGHEHQVQDEGNAAQEYFWLLLYRIYMQLVVEFF